MNLPIAQRLAEKIAAELSSYCERLEIAGSIRRRRPNCNDVDLVCLPKAGRTVALLHRCSENATLVQGDKVNFIYRLKNGVQLDVFLAQPRDVDLLKVTPGNFGSLLLCRTGSKEHNIYLIGVAKGLGLRWNPHHGVYSDLGCVASETEEEIFKALGLEFIAPEKRER